MNLLKKTLDYMERNIACDVSGITTKAPCEAALMGERYVRIETSDFVMRTFAPKILKDCGLI